MKRIHGWTLLGVGATGLAALLLGETVLGQPEVKVPVPPPLIVQQVEKPALQGGEGKPAVEAPGGTLPLFPPMAPVDLPGRNPVTLPMDPPALSPSPQLPSPPGTSFSKLEQATALLPAKVEKAGADASLPSIQPGRQQPAVSIEWGGPSSIRVNQPMACQIVVRNTSTTPVHNVIVRHRPGQGVTCKNSEPRAEQDVGDLVWNLGTLAPDQTRRIDLVLVTQTRGPLTCPATVTFSAVAAHQVQVREPQLATKVSGPDKAIVGETVNLLVSISNPGDGVTDAVKFKVMIPDGLEHPRGKVVEVEVGNLAPKESRSFQLPCLAKGSGMQAYSIAVNGDGGLSARDTAQLEILVPGLQVAMSGPKLRYLDRRAIYVVKVTNPGNAPVSAVEVQGLIPSGFKFHQANLGGLYQEATRLVSWNVGDLQPGQSKDLAIDLIPVEAGEHRLTAHGKAARGLKADADARTMVEGLSSLFIEVGHLDDPLEVGAETTYEIRLANTGTKTETNIEVVCTIPEQLEFKGAKSGAIRFRQEGRELIFEPLAKLAPKADVIYKVHVRGIAPGDIRFRTRVKADGLKDPLVRDESTRIYRDDAPLRTTTNTLPAPRVSDPVVPAPNPLPLPTPNAPSSLPMPSSPAPTLPPVSGSIPSLPAPGPLPTPRIDR